jgi:hypothetical protein
MLGTLVLHPTFGKLVEKSKKEWKRSFVHIFWIYFDIIRISIAGLHKRSGDNMSELWKSFVEVPFHGLEEYGHSGEVHLRPTDQ